MKKNLLFLLFVAVSFCVEVRGGNVVVYRMRNLDGAEVVYSVFLNDSLVVGLRNNSFYSDDYPAGDYELRVTELPDVKLRFRVENGKTTYVRCSTMPGVYSYCVNFEQTDSTTASGDFDFGPMKDVVAERKVVLKNRHRCGFNVSYGIRLGDVPVLQAVGDRYYAGGGSFGVVYGYEFSSYFDLALRMYYQFSDFKPLFSSEKVRYSRCVVSLDPASKFPIGRREKWKGRFGIGLDKYFFEGVLGDGLEPNLEFGYHVSVGIEYKRSDRWSYDGGLRWYTLTEDASGFGKPSEVELDPGMEVNVGVCRHF